MSLFRRHREREVPGLNMSSMPDLIFTVLFFFMIVTHMRSVPVKVKYQVPAGTELTKLTRKTAITYIYIGKPLTATAGKGADGQTLIQLNDKFADISHISPFVRKERAEMSIEDKKNMVVSLKADRETPMGIITDVKQELRQSGAFRLNYSATNR
jgi:biopolymer transport protein ExbD